MQNNYLVGTIENPCTFCGIMHLRVYLRVCIKYGEEKLLVIVWECKEN